MEGNSCGEEDGWIGDRETWISGEKSDSPSRHREKPDEMEARAQPPLGGRSDLSDVVVARWRRSLVRPPRSFAAPVAGCCGPSTHAFPSDPGGLEASRRIGRGVPTPRSIRYRSAPSVQETVLWPPQLLGQARHPRCSGNSGLRIAKSLGPVPRRSRALLSRRRFELTAPNKTKGAGFLPRLRGTTPELSSELSLD